MVPNFALASRCRSAAAQTAPYELQRHSAESRLTFLRDQAREDIAFIRRTIEEGGAYAIARGPVDLRHCGGDRLSRHLWPPLPWACLVLVRAKGTPIHKRRGRVYALTLLVTSPTALDI